MATQENATLGKLTDFGETVADAADDIRGRKVKDADDQYVCVVPSRRGRISSERWRAVARGSEPVRHASCIGVEPNRSAQRGKRA
jgi:hypothetical protein